MPDGARIDGFTCSHVDRFEVARWKEAVVHPDHHLAFDTGCYSLPTRYVGQTLWMRGTSVVQIFDQEGSLIRTRERVTDRRQRRTNCEDYPPDKRVFLIHHPRYCRGRARQMGPAVGLVGDRILDSHAYAHLRKVQSILRLGEKFGADRLNRACEPALACDDLDHRTIKNILVRGLDQGPVELEEPAAAMEAPMYVRPPEPFVHDLAVAVGGGGA